MSPNKKDSGTFTHSLEETSGLFRMGVVERLDMSRIVIAEKDELDRQISSLQASDARTHFARSDYKDVYAFFRRQVSITTAIS